MQHQILSPSVLLARISLMREVVKELKGKEVNYFGVPLNSSIPCDQVYLSGKTLKEPLAPTKAGIFRQSCKRLPTSGVIDLNGNCAILDGFYPKIDRESTLSDILMEKVDPAYFLSSKAIKSLTRRATRNAKKGNGNKAKVLFLP